MQNHIFIPMTVDQLKLIITECIKKVQPEKVPKDKEDELIKIQEVAKLLSVSKVTIHEWKKKGIIPFHRMGRRVFFKKHEILEALKKASIRK